MIFINMYMVHTQKHGNLSHEIYSSYRDKYAVQTNVSNTKAQLFCCKSVKLMILSG